jgi:leader peptidase (prepilin peptidase)/N-methyltransferase
MGAWAAVVCVLAWFVGLSWYDIRQRRLPNWLTVPGAVAILACATAAGRGTPALAGAAALFAIYLALHAIDSTAMGAGDVKLAIGIGALTGAFGVDVWMLAALGAPLLTAGWAVVAAVMRAQTTVPHGPSMCVTAAASALVVMV